MSRRVYTKDHQSVMIESTGTPVKNATDEDIWYVTTKLEEGIEISSILWTSQVKEILARLEAANWKKEATGEKETT